MLPSAGEDDAETNDCVLLSLQNFLNSSSCPEIQGHLYMKEPGRKSWKKLYMFLRRSGLYYSTKGTSKVRRRRGGHVCVGGRPPLTPSLPEQEPRHLQLLSDLDDNNVFTIITGRKLHNAPTDFQFCIKVRHEDTSSMCVCVCERTRGLNHSAGARTHTQHCVSHPRSYLRWVTC